MTTDCTLIVVAIMNLMKVRLAQLRRYGVKPWLIICKGKRRRVTEAVETFIIKPMLTLYPPPQHLRNDPEAFAEALATYVRVLARFDRGTLARAWDQVVASQSYWCWPSPGMIVEACCGLAPPPPAIGENEQRHLRAQALADAYASRFMKTTHLARLARDEGWLPELAEYVREAAWVQAQLIEGIKQIGFATLLIPEDQRVEPAADCFATYRETITASIERGRIRVSVPPGRVREWRNEEQREQAKRVSER
ncbi:hypothetical protein [Fimbriiglobus ruber]|uniref:hypothetical protein n=1 Tax=Fimbriiglobus ruber TaxID=1908690 RepID=UPI00117AE106|nr:hypothetical protein [Fimbriiglobus ruber]